jgi:hypothetical protein
MTPGTRVHILAFVGSTFDPCWKEKGTVLKPTARQRPPSAEWSIVRYDGGGTLCIHQSRLMIANERARSRIASASLVLAPLVAS